MQEEQNVDALVESISNAIEKVSSASLFLPFMCSFSLLFFGYHLLVVVIPSLSCIPLVFRLLLYVCLLYLNYGSLFFLLKTAMVSPGYERSLTDEETPCTSDDSRYCTICKRNVHSNSQHCPICNECILEYDHHCVWIGNCVGFKNARYFALFMLYCGLFFLFGAVNALCYTILSRRYHILEVGNMIVFELLLGFTVGLLLIGVSLVEMNTEVKRDVALGCGCYV
ncbi:hypothetical protein BLSTO_01859 [Blastocystis sp. subtype 1]